MNTLQMSCDFFNPLDADTWIFRDNHGNTEAADVLAVCVARPSPNMLLT